MKRIHLDAFEVGFSAGLKVGMLEFPYLCESDMIAEADRLRIRTFSLIWPVSSSTCLICDCQLHTPRYRVDPLTFEKPYLFNCRTKLEKLECRNVCGLLVSLEEIPVG